MKNCNWKILKLVILSLVVLSSSLTAWAFTSRQLDTWRLGGPFVEVNYAMVPPGEALPFMQRDRMQVPLRDLANAVGAELDVRGDNLTVTLYDRTVELNVDTRYYRINDKQKTWDMAPVYASGTTFVDASNIAYALGGSYKWDKGRATGSMSFERAAIGGQIRGRIDRIYGSTRPEISLAVEKINQVVRWSTDEETIYQFRDSKGRYSAINARDIDEGQYAWLSLTPNNRIARMVVADKLPGASSDTIRIIGEVNDIDRDRLTLKGGRWYYLENGAKVIDINDRAMEFADLHRGDKVLLNVRREYPTMIRIQTDSWGDGDIGSGGESWNDSRISDFRHDARRTLREGDKVSFVLETNGNGRAAWVEIANGWRSIKLHQSSDKRSWWGSYTVTRGDRISNAVVNAYFENMNGRRYEATASQRLNIGTVGSGGGWNDDDYDNDGQGEVIGGGGSSSGSYVRIREFTHDANRILRQGDELRITMRTENGLGTRAWAEIGNNWRRVELRRSSSTTWAGEYRIQRNDRISDAKVTGYLEAQNNSRDEETASRRVTIDGGIGSGGSGGSWGYNITAPDNEQLVRGKLLVAAGTGTPGSRVVVTYNYITTAEARITTREGRVGSDGRWMMQALKFEAGDFPSAGIRFDITAKFYDRNNREVAKDSIACRMRP